MAKKKGRRSTGAHTQHQQGPSTSRAASGTTHQAAHPGNLNQPSTSSTRTRSEEEVGSDEFEYTATQTQYDMNTPYYNPLANPNDDPLLRELPPEPGSRVEVRRNKNAIEPQLIRAPQPQPKKRKSTEPEPIVVQPLPVHEQFVNKLEVEMATIPGQSGQNNKRFIVRKSIHTTSTLGCMVDRRIVSLGSFLPIFGMIVYSWMMGHDIDNSTINLVYDSFAQMEKVATLWVLCFFGVIVMYFVSYFWSCIAIKLNSKCLKIVWTTIGGFIILVYFMINFYSLPIIMDYLRLPCGSRCVIIGECVRFMMKMYAFVRTVCPKALEERIHTTHQLQFPSFTSFFRFLFVPTLVYNHEYPIAAINRFPRISCLLIEMFVCIMILAAFFEMITLPTVPEWSLISTIIVFGISGASTLVITHFVVLHIWLNMWASLIQFGDRQFYEDWWNSLSFGEYFRKWNIVVSDWLYYYIYKDVHDILFPRNKLIAKVIVFLVSAIVHEWIVANILGYFYPFLFIAFFVCGTIFSFIPPITNPRYQWISRCIFRISFMFGCGLILWLYATEYRYVIIEKKTMSPSFRHRYLPVFVSIQYKDFFDKFNNPFETITDLYYSYVYNYLKKIIF